MFRVPLKKPVRDKEHAHCPITGVNFLAVKAVKLMLTFLGIKLSYETLSFLLLFLGSELLGASKFKSNGVVQLLLSAINSLKPFRNEDERLAKAKELLK